MMFGLQDADDDHDDVDAEVEIESSQYPQHIGDDDEDDVSQQQHSAVMVRCFACC